MPSALFLVPRQARPRRARHHTGGGPDLSQFGVTQSSDGSFTFDAKGALGNAAPAAVAALANSSILPAPLASDVGMALTAMGAIATAGGVSAGATAGLSLLATAIFSAFYAITLIPGVGAAGGPGDTCCNDGGRYGSCGADAFVWTTQVGPYLAPPAGTFEAFANAAIETGFNSIVDCSHEMDPGAFAAGMLPALIAAWNKAHASAGTAKTQPASTFGGVFGFLGTPATVVTGSGGTRTISVRCNIDPNPGSSAGFQNGEPAGNDPISVGLNYVATLINCPSYASDPFGPCDMSGGPFPVGGTIKIVVNNGPAIMHAGAETNNLPTGGSLIPPGWTAPAPPALPVTAVLAASGMLHMPTAMGSLPPPAAPQRPSFIGLGTLLGCASALAFGWPLAAAGVLVAGGVAGFIEALEEL